MIQSPYFVMAILYFLLVIINGGLCIPCEFRPLLETKNDLKCGYQQINVCACVVFIFM